MKTKPTHARSAIAACLLLAWFAVAGARAATFVRADVTALLGPTFFVDDAVAGGSDSTINQPSVVNYVRTFAGLLAANQGTTEVRITGLGFATSTAASSNDATSITASFTYLGADGAAGGGDDVFVGSATGGYVYASSGEYACVFDAPLVATLNITALKFQVAIAPSKPGGGGSVLLKTGTIPFDGFTGGKLSVAGTVSTALPAVPQRVNLARYQATTTSTENGQYLAGYATDGAAGNLSWRSANVTTAHWAEVAFPVPVTIRSAHIFCGIDDGSVPGSFKVQYFSGASWVDAPGSSRTGNTSPEVNVIFTSAVTSDRFRLYSDNDGTFRVKEFALFPPNAVGGVEQGFPIGTDVEVNLARERPAVASATSGTNYAKLAVDGFVSSASKWQVGAGTHTLDIDLRVATKIGSAHLYSGDGSVPPLASFTLKYWDGAAWLDIPGGVVTGNASAERVVTFSTAPTTSMVRLTFTTTATRAVRELCVFPANGGAGYPLGQDVLGVNPPAQDWEDYHDAFYNVQNRAADLPLSVSGATPVLHLSTLDAALSQYQVLLNVGTDTVRLRNRVTGKCLAGAGVSTVSGAALVDEDYTAMPHQSWRLVSVDGTDFFLRNVWSGLVADTQAGGTAAGTALVQAAISGSTTQHWRFVFQTHYPKKGMAGYVDQWAEIQGLWAYSWSRKTTVELPADVIFNPMQWGNFNWDLGSTEGPVEQYFPEWRRQDQAMFYLGFNEPDRTDQANMTVAKAIELWPRMERMDMPLVAPVPADTEGVWMDDFMTQAQARGYRMDAVANHSYPDPAGGNPDAIITRLQNLNTTWGRPVWMTEFSTVDWNGTGTWTEEDNYNWLAEFMWRAESLPWLRRYSLFLFTASTTYPVPANPWDTVAPRSNAFQTDGTTPTSFGELYFAWDGDATVRGEKAYFIHNKGERKRVRNATGSTGPTARYIRDGGNTVQWVLRPTGTAGQWYIVSLRDGRRLRYSGSTLDFAPALTTGTAVRWSLVEDVHGWFYVENPAAPAANRRLKYDSSVWSMVSSTSTVDQNKWRFIVPFAPVDAAPPAAPANVTATAGSTQVTLSWTASTSADFSFYTVYRSTTSGGPYTLTATNLTTPGFTNTGLQNGTIYHYVITATDWTGSESAQSAQSVITPVIATPPLSLGITPSGGNVTISWPATHLGWQLQWQTNGLAPGNWTTEPASATTTSMSWPLTPAEPVKFFRLKHP